MTDPRTIDDKYRHAPDPKSQLAEIMGKGKRRVAKSPPPPEQPLTGELLITLDVPPQSLNPNVRKHWRPKAKTTKWFKASTALHCQQQMVPKLHLREAKVQTTIYFATKRNRDEDNALASMKAAFDGLVMYGLFADDRGLRHQPIVLAVDETNPRTEVRIWKARDQ